jgi:hypothetical protein
MLIPRFTEESISKLRAEWYGITWNYAEKICFKKQPKVIKCFGTEFREFACIFAPGNGIQRFFNFCRMVRNGFPRVYVLVARN